MVRDPLRPQGFDKLTAWLDALVGGGPGVSGVETNRAEIRTRMGRWSQRTPRDSVRSARRSQESLHGTTCVHVVHKKGQLLVNGSADGLVELTIEPACFTDRTPSTMFVKERVTSPTNRKILLTPSTRCSRAWKPRSSPSAS